MRLLNWLWTGFNKNIFIRKIIKCVVRFLYPLSIDVEGFGYTLGSRDDQAKLYYSVILFQPETIEQGANIELQPPPGIFCPRTSIHPPQTFPDFPNQFSVNIETLDSSNRFNIHFLMVEMNFSNLIFPRVSYSEHNYNLKQKLVSMKFSPRLLKMLKVLFSLYNLHISGLMDPLHQSSSPASPSLIICSLRPTTSFMTSTLVSSTLSARELETAGQ